MTKALWFVFFFSHALNRRKSSKKKKNFSWLFSLMYDDYDADYSPNQPHATRTIYKKFIWDYKLRIFAKMTRNSKSNTKLTYEFSFVLFIPKYQIIHENALLFVCYFSSKMNILPYHPHLQVFTILFVPSMHQPPWTTKLKLLMHLKIDFHSSYIIS